MELLIFLGSLFFFMCFGVPLAVVLVLCSIVLMFHSGMWDAMIIPNTMLDGTNNYPLMAIPFFVFAGEIMAAGGLSKRVVALAEVMVGRIRGGLGYAAIVASIIFAGLMGSSVGEAAALGGLLLPMMQQVGYDKGRAGAVIASGAILGPIIPPSIVIVFFGTVTSVSITRLFAGSLGAGILLAALLFALTYFKAVRNKWPKREKNDPKPGVWKSFKESFWALLMPVIVLGGIYGGIFTPTEAAAVSIFYAWFVGLVIYKELNPKNIFRILKDSAESATIVLFIIGASSVFAWLFTYANIAAQVNAFVTSMNVGPLLYLFLVCIVMLIFGCFMDATATIVLLMPMMFPLSQTLGIDPIHFGIAVTFALTLGALTPPVAVNIFAMASVSKLPMGRIVKGEIPYALMAVISLILVILIPKITLFFPGLLT